VFRLQSAGSRRKENDTKHSRCGKIGISALANRRKTSSKQTERIVEKVG
jgi:hypothetical protein